MAIFGNMFASASVTTGIGGTCTLTVQVPGTFDGVTPVNAANGRALKSALIWADVPTIGDMITTLQIEDIDGVVPVPVRAAFPAYPVIFDLIDTIGGVKSSVMLPPEPLFIESQGETGEPTVRFIPSQLYLKASFQSGTLAIGKTFRFLVKWGAWQ